jgi:putative flippase GtrA
MRYTLFAAIATGANLGIQHLVLCVFTNPHSIYLAIATGTAIGINIKYFLDSRFIFSCVDRPIGEGVLTFLLYVAMSGVTTAVFWGVELLFDALFSAEAAKYVGALVGLLVGYTLKYRLDRRFVFQPRRSR